MKHFEPLIGDWHGDARRLCLEDLAGPGEDWNGPHGPGFNQRFGRLGGALALAGRLPSDGEVLERDVDAPLRGIEMLGRGE